MTNKTALLIAIVLIFSAIAYRHSTANQCYMPEEMLEELLTK